MVINVAKYEKIVKNFVDKNVFLIFAVTIAVALFLRFHNIEHFQPFGWDQARDAWNARDILMGKTLLVGPRTGIGELHLAPLYYYALAPFFYITNLDPIATLYFNFVCNLVNFLLIFYVTRKIFGNYAALFTIFVYSFSNYIITINQVPWNVTLMSGVAAAIFYSLVRIYQEDYRWVYIMWGLSGFYFNLHFTAILLPIINVASLVFVKDKKKVIKNSILSIPLYLIWFIGPIIYFLKTAEEVKHFSDFTKNYYIGFHLKFFLAKRLSDAFVQFKTILFIPVLKQFSFIFPVIFLGFLAIEKNRWQRILGYLILLWFVVPAIAFTLYGGPVSEYYYLYSVPMVIWILFYLQRQVIKTKLKYITALALLIFWIFYAWQNVSAALVKPETGGIYSSKKEVNRLIKQNEKIPFSVGDIKAYLYQIWAIDKK